MKDAMFALPTLLPSALPLILRATAAVVATFPFFYTGRMIILANLGSREER